MVDSNATKTTKKTVEFATTQTPNVVFQSAVAPCSVEINRNAKGEPSWSVKAYCERNDLEKCADDVLAIDSKLRKTTKGADQDGEAVR